MGRQTGIGIAVLAVTVLAGFLLYRVLDRHIYEYGINLNLKLAALVLAGFLVVVAVMVVRALTRSRRRSR